MMEPIHLLHISRLKVHNANAMGCPYIIGFPAITAWLGMVHKLERELHKSGYPLHLKATSVVCHQMDLQTYKHKGDYISSIIATANPSKLKTGNEVQRPPFIEEARCHLTVSLAILVVGEALNGLEHQHLYDCIENLLHAKIKAASGNIEDVGQVKLDVINSDEQLSSSMKTLLPSYALIDRHDLLKKALKEHSDTNSDDLDTFLDFFNIKHTYVQKNEAFSEEKETFEWVTTRKEKGWLVPLAVGYQGISDLGLILNRRDENTPHRFAESVLSVAEFKMPIGYDKSDIHELFWQYKYDETNQMYLCKQAEPFFNYY